MLKKVAFTVYPVADAQVARDFYEGQLGLEVGAHGGQGGMFWIEYDLPGGGCFALSNATKAKPGAEGGGTIAFEVEDLDALTDKLRAAGAQVEVETPIHGPNCRMVPVLDPDGNAIILHQLNKK